MIAEIQRVVKALLGYGARMPKELMLFVKNMVFLDGAIASLAPDLDLFAEIANISMYFAQTHGERIAAEVGIDPDELRDRPHGREGTLRRRPRATRRLTYRELQQRRELIRADCRSRVTGVQPAGRARELGLDRGSPAGCGAHTIGASGQPGRAGPAGPPESASTRVGSLGCEPARPTASRPSARLRRPNGAAHSWRASPSSRVHRQRGCVVAAASLPRRCRAGAGAVAAVAERTAARRWTCRIGTFRPSLPRADVGHDRGRRRSSRSRVARSSTSGSHRLRRVFPLVESVSHVLWLIPQTVVDDRRAPLPGLHTVVDTSCTDFDTVGLDATADVRLRSLPDAPGDRPLLGRLRRSARPPTCPRPSG